MLFPPPMQRILAALPLMALTSLAVAADRHVPSVYNTIQAAINASSNGDTVLIEPGVFFENININGKNITIKPLNNKFQTIIDGQQSGSVVTFSGNESANCSLRNLTIRNGKATQGGGIKGNYTMAYFKNCTIINNESTGNGGGVHGIAGLMEGCTISNNKAVNGGGVAGLDGILDACVISNNLATTNGGGFHNIDGEVRFSQISGNEAANRGGGIHLAAGHITANLISENKVTASGPVASPNSFGGGIADAEGTVTLNMIVENASNGDGGGISNTTGVIQNNVLAENTARRGGGLANITGNVENNTIWSNTASTIGGGVFNGGAHVSNTIIYNNTAPTDPQWSGAAIPSYCCIQNWAGGQPDIITAAPQLFNPAKNRYDLLPTSPCVDAGKLIPGLVMDFEGEPRPFNGTATPAGDGSDFDIGADEYMPANIDLVAALPSVKVKYKGVMPNQKTQISGTMTVTNNGSDVAEPPSTIMFYLSSDNVLDPGDTQIGKTVTLKKLSGSKVKKVKLKAKLFNQNVSGQYIIGVADTTNVVVETNEGNNQAIYGPLP